MDEQNVFFVVGQSVEASTERPVPIRRPELTAQEERLGYDLPSELRTFYERVGTGHFRFGQVFDARADQYGSSELDQELEDFRERQAERLRRLRTSDQVELLPFARNHLGTVYLLNLLEQTSPGELWVWESEAQGGDTPTAGGTLEHFLRKLYHTEIAAVEVTMDQVKDAIRERREIELSYRHQPGRIVHPIKLGEHTLLAFQVGGYNPPGEDGTIKLMDFRSLFPAFINNVRETGNTFTVTDEQLRELDIWQKGLRQTGQAEWLG